MEQVGWCRKHCWRPLSSPASLRRDADKWASRPDMRLLFGNLSLEKAPRSGTRSANRACLRASQRRQSIYVPADNVYTLGPRWQRRPDAQGRRTRLRNLRQQQAGRQPVCSENELQPRLQGELARTIQVFEAWNSHACTCPSRPDDVHHEAKRPRPPSCCVSSRLQLSGVTVAAITNLVAGSVEGLSPKM